MTKQGGGESLVLSVLFFLFHHIWLQISGGRIPIKTPNLLHMLACEASCDSSTCFILFWFQCVCVVCVDIAHTGEEYSAIE